MSHQTKQYRWSPQPDITAYELALCLPALVVHNAPGVERMVESLPPEARRHFEEMRTL